MKETAEEKAFEVMKKEEQDKLDAISKKNGGIKVILLKVPKNDEYTEFAYGYIKYPDRTDISIAMTMKDTDPLKGKEIVLRNSWLEGDEEILKDTELFLSACTVLDEVIGVRQALVKKNWVNGQ
ncbi:MAG: hypothetical protein ACT4OJ_01260 [Bacteroidota bacterium]